MQLIKKQIMFVYRLFDYSLYDQSHIQRKARSVTCRLTKNRTPITQMHGEIYQELIEELKTGEVTCLPTDTVVPKYNFSKKY